MVIGLLQISIATICAAPLKTNRLIAAASASVSPFCAATVPNATPNTAVPGKSASVCLTPKRRPVEAPTGRALFRNHYAWNS